MSSIEQAQAAVLGAHLNVSSGTFVTCYECGIRFRTYKDLDLIGDSECCGCSDEEEFAA